MGSLRDFTAKDAKWRPACSLALRARAGRRKGGLPEDRLSAGASCGLGDLTFANPGRRSGRLCVEKSFRHSLPACGWADQPVAEKMGDFNAEDAKWRRKDREVRK